jgi:hypothetical protein
MDYPDYANTQVYLKALYDTASHNRLIREAGSDRRDASPGLLGRLRSGSLVLHPGRPAPDQYDDGFLTLKLHVG